MPDDVRLVLGTERFRIRRRLGQGGMGVVYEAWDGVVGERVALKTLSHMGPNAIYRFKKEFRRACELRHPNLVQLKELHANPVSWFFTMELVEGQDLDFRRMPVRTLPEWTEPLTWNTTQTAVPTTARSGGQGGFDGETTEPLDSPFSGWDPAQEQDLRKVLRSLGEALSALHEAGIVHRDLKPPNVRVQADRSVVLLDFGLATHLDEESLAASTTGLLAGTVPYLAPEQAVGEKVTPAADWYAFGCILYEALTGRLPYEGPVYQQLLDKQTKRPISVATRQPDAPRDLADLAMKLLQPMPTRRPSSDELRGVLDLNVRPVQSLRGPDLEPQPPSHGGLRAALDRPAETLRVACFARGGQAPPPEARMAHALAHLRHHHGALTLTGRCRLREHVPFQGVDDLMDQLGRKLKASLRHPQGYQPSMAVASLARAFPSLRRIPWLQRAAERADDDRTVETLTRGWTELMTHLAGNHAIALGVETFDDVDEDSLSLLCATADALPPASTWLMITAKTPDAPRWLQNRLPHAEFHHDPAIPSVGP